MKDVRTATLPRFLICTPLIVSGLGPGQGSIVAEDTGDCPGCRLVLCQSTLKGRCAWGSWAGRRGSRRKVPSDQSYIRIPRALDNAQRGSTPGYAALHRAMNPGLQKGDLGPAIEWPERRFQELGPKAGLPDRSDWRTFGLVPGDVEAIV